MREVYEDMKLVRILRREARWWAWMMWASLMVVWGLTWAVARISDPWLSVMVFGVHCLVALYTVLCAAWSISSALEAKRLHNVISRHD